LRGDCCLVGVLVDGLRDEDDALISIAYVTLRLTGCFALGGYLRGAQHRATSPVSGRASLAAL
jgi:hypothetical protein